MFDIVIENGKVVDGTGNVWYQADIGIESDIIKDIGDLSNVSAKQSINAEDKIVTPGFIDTHSHSDLKLLDDPFMTPKLAQGITTEVIGQDGLSIFPLSPDITQSMRNRISGLLGKAEFSFHWNSFSEYCDKLEAGGIGTNIVALAPHGNIRALVMGFENRKPSDEELSQMKEALGNVLQQGAVGMSTGLIYPPCVYADQEELIALCKTVAEYNGIFVTHMRDEGDALLSAMDEVIGIASQGDVPLHISHFKVAFKQNWGKSKKSIKKLETARRQNVEVTFDQYPYVAGSTMLDAILPPWSLEGGTKEMLSRLEDSSTRKKIKQTIKEGNIKQWPDHYKGCGPGGIIISSVESERNKNMEGKTFKELAKMKDKDPLDIAFDLLVEEEASVSMIHFYGSKEDVKRIMQHKAGMACTDGIFPGTPHPRTYGAMPKILRKYVREQQILSLEDAIRRMTSFPARRFGLYNRGILSEGMKADIVILDYSQIKDTATYENPRQYPKGIEYVLVNGKIAIQKTNRTETLSGKIIKIT